MALCRSTPDRALNRLTKFTVEAIEPMHIAGDGRLTNMYMLSPFVWAQDGGFHLLLRAVPRRDDEPRLKMAEIWYGESTDGLNFKMDPGPTLFPGPGKADLDGCEDPTVVTADGRTHVWYTGYNQSQQTGRLLYAEGSGPRKLAKAGVALDSTSEFANPKEATVALAADGDWRLFFEYARDDASRLGVARASSLEGPWTAGESALARREGVWDDWHLSTGPVIGEGSKRPIMFYNGATQNAHWRIGWAAFDAKFEKVVERSDLPLIEPDAHQGSSETDIAFAASAIERPDRIWLYYSISDQKVMRATLKRS